MDGPITTCRCAVSLPSLKDACTTPASMYTESPAARVVDSRSRNCVTVPCLTMIISSCPSWRWKSCPSPGSRVTSITTSCLAPVLAGRQRQPIVPQSNCSCSTSGCLTKPLICLLCLKRGQVRDLTPIDDDRLEAAHVLGHRDLRRQALHRGGAEEADD